jgi:hypothetical protein
MCFSHVNDMSFLYNIINMLKEFSAIQFEEKPRPVCVATHL